MCSTSAAYPSGRAASGPKPRGTDPEWLSTLGPPTYDRQAHSAQKFVHLDAWSAPCKTRKVRIVLVLCERSRYQKARHRRSGWEISRTRRWCARAHEQRGCLRRHTSKDRAVDEHELKSLITAFGCDRRCLPEECVVGSRPQAFGKEFPYLVTFIQAMRESLVRDSSPWCNSR
jgi:hypothetical protein